MTISKSDILFEEYIEKDFPPFIDKVIANLNGRNRVGVNEFRKIVVFTRLNKKDVDDVIGYLSERGLVKRQGKMIYIL